MRCISVRISAVERAAVGVAEVIEAGKRQIGRILGQLSLGGARLDQFLQAVAGGAAEHDQIDQRVRAQAVGTVDRNAGRFAHGEQARHDRFGIAVGTDGDDFAVIVRRNAAHVVMDSRHDRQRLARQVNTCENLAAFGDAGQTLGQHLGIDVIEVQVDVVLVRTDTATFTDFQRHRARHDVAAAPDPWPKGRSAP